MQKTPEKLLAAAAQLASEADRLSFETPRIHTVYNPLLYAWEAHQAFISRYGTGRKDVVFVGMNPGPWGMAQTGVPFGEVNLVREWLKIEEPVEPPANVHPKRPIEGFSCRRSEVSGRRLWGLMKDRFGTAESFFAQHFAVNYCPLVFMEESGKNLTPDKLQKRDRNLLFGLCDIHMDAVIRALSPAVLVGVGKFAEKQLQPFTAEYPSLRITSIPHPSPANPQANKGWAEPTAQRLEEEGIW